MKLSKKLENLFSATAFAEEGEFETAREIIAENNKPGTPAESGADVRLGTPPITQGRLAPKA